MREQEPGVHSWTVLNKDTHAKVEKWYHLYKNKGYKIKSKYEKSQVRDIEPTHEMGCLNKKAVPTNIAGKS